MIPTRKTKTVLFFSLLFSALALGTTFAHVLELPQKLSVPIELYTVINATLYKWFALAGGPICLLAVFFSFWLVRINFLSGLRTLSFLYAALLHAGWFASWLSLVQPVNTLIKQAMSAHQTVVDVWAEHLWRWEGGHLLGFILHLGAFCFLVKGVLSLHSGKCSSLEDGRVPNI